MEIKKTEVDKEYQEFLKRKSIFDTTLNDIEELKKSLEELSGKLKERQGRFDEFLENAKETLDRFRQEQEKELTVQVEEGRRKLEEMDQYKEQAKQTLRWTEVAALKTAYENRADELNKKARDAFIIFIVSSILIAFYSVGVVYVGEFFFKDNGIWFLIARVALIAPALLLGWKLWANYRETKLLADEYTHKKILSENLMIGVQTLKERLNVEREEAKEKFLDPTLIKLLEDPIEKVYKLKVKDEYELSLLERCGILSRREKGKNKEEGRREEEA